MLKRSFLAIPLVAMLSMSLLTACGDKKEAAAPAKEEKVLRVGTNPTFAPFEFQAKGSNDLTGFDIDLAKALGKQMGYKVELVNLGFDGLIPALSTGNIDLAVSGMSITEERKNAVDFCDPYYTSGLIVLVRPDETNIKNINDLVGKRIGAQIGTTGYDAAQSLQSLWFLQQKRSRCNGLIFINRNQFRCAMQQKAPVTGGFFVVSAGCLEASYKRFDVVCRDVL